MDGGVRKLGVATGIPPLGWTVIVEQPTAEAYANATQLQRQLVRGDFGGAPRHALDRPGVRAIVHLADSTLQRATQAVASGQLDARVDIRTGDEFSVLGDAFNTMANRLVELQENIKRQERQAMFGRIAAGLVHDLAHPIQNLGNSLATADPRRHRRGIATVDPRHDRAGARDPQAVHGRPATRRQAAAGGALLAGRQWFSRGSGRGDARRRGASGGHVSKHVTPRLPW